MTKGPRTLDLLIERSAYRPFLGAMTLSAIGDGIATAALVLYVEAIEGTGVAVGALLLTQTLPRLVGPLAGSVADRIHTLRVLIACDLGQCLLYGLIAVLLPSLGPLLGLVLAASLLQSGTSAGRGALLPSLVGHDRLLGANVLLGAGFNLQVALGPVAGAVLFAAGGPEIALAVNAATFLVSALLLMCVRAPATAASPPRGVLAEIGEAVGFAAREPLVRTLLIGLTASIAFLSLENVALVFLVKDTLGGGSAAFGAVLAAFGVGMLIGSLAMAIANPRSAISLFVLALALSGTGTLLSGLAPTIVFAAAFQAIAGIGNALDNAASDTLIQRTVPAAMLGRVFGLMSAMAYAGAGLSAAAGGPLLDLTSPRTVVIIGGLGGLVVMLVAAGVFRSAAGGMRSPARPGP